VVEWTHQWMEEGRARGMEEGRLHGEADFFLRLLEKRFGAVDARLRSRIQSARSEQLEAWGERLLGARSLGEIFGD
jgi:hypothetical protein